MDATTKIAAPPKPSAIVWPSPIINDVSAAFDATSCLMERAQALLNSNSSDLADLCEGLDATVSPWLRERIYNIWMIFVLAGEKFGEIDVLIRALHDKKLADRRTSVGKHTAIMRRSAWIAAVEAYKAAEAVPVDENTDDVIFDAAAKAYQAMVATPAPDLRAFHEKMTLIEQGGGWHTDGTIPALFTDIEAFVRASAAAAFLED